MTIEELKKVIAANEGETVEFKESTGQRGEACKTLCAFLNKNGGMVVFGVSKKGKLTGQLVADTTKRDLFDAFQKFEPAADIEVAYVPADETHVAIVCQVEKGNARPYAYDGTPYKRVQSSTTVMSQEEYEWILQDRGGFRSDWESQVNPTLTLDEIDCEEVKKTARMAVQVGRLDSEVDTDDVLTLLKKFKVMHGGQLTNGAAVLFGNDDLFGYPQCEIKMARFKGTTKNEFGDERREEGNIFKLLGAATQFCFKHLNLSAKVVSGQNERIEQLEIPPEALRETILNALVHRQYSKNGSVSLAIYDDRLEVTSPGGFPPGKTVEQIISEHESEPRNQQIAHVLYLRKTIETWGRGFVRINAECEKTGVPLPLIAEKNGYVRITFERTASRGSNQTSPTAKSGHKSDKVGMKSGHESTKVGMKSGYKAEDVRLRVEDMFDKALPSLRKDVRPSLISVLAAMAVDPYASIPKLALVTSIPRGTIRNAQEMLKDLGLVFRVGGKRGGHWLISWKDGKQ